ncbi:MAG: dihydroorotase family protein [Treponema sp.]|nr:dihydroorotase family protein [Treponema sp.]MCL2250351.1 dihydroorotase family protein [Treponema sp.]
MHYDLLIKNGLIVTPNKTFKGDIAITSGIIAQIEFASCNGVYENTADLIYDAEGKHILPGIIDAHVHFRDPGLTEKEDFESGSIAAAMGGITMVADMPNVIPVTSSVQRFNEKIEIARRKSYIDFALFALLTDENLKETEDLKNAGALGFKVFFGTSTGDVACPSLPILLEQMQKCKEIGMRIGFHCETSELNSYLTTAFKQATDAKIAYNNAGLWLTDARPVFSETLAIQTVICYAKYTGAKIHIHHITSSDGTVLVSEAKQKGIDISSETCPHYLFFDAEKYTHKVYPPIRDEKNRLALWEAINKKVIDIIASDHAPHTAKEKSLPIWDAPAGLCGTETLVSLFLNEVNKGKLSINDFVRLASENPAKIWGIYPQKGNIEPGADADITIVDLKKKTIIKAENLHSKSKTSPYDGMEVQGVPVATIVRGNFVMKDGELTGEKGYGVLVSPN